MSQKLGVCSHLPKRGEGRFLITIAPFGKPSPETLALIKELNTVGKSLGIIIYNGDPEEKLDAALQKSDFMHEGMSVDLDMALNINTCDSELKNDWSNASAIQDLISHLQTNYKQLP